MGFQCVRRSRVARYHPAKVCYMAGRAESEGGRLEGGGKGRRREEGATDVPPLSLPLSLSSAHSLPRSVTLSVCSVPQCCSPASLIFLSARPFISPPLPSSIAPLPYYSFFRSTFPSHRRHRTPNLFLHHAAICLSLLEAQVHAWGNCEASSCKMTRSFKGGDTHTYIVVYNKWKINIELSLFTSIVCVSNYPCDHGDQLSSKMRNTHHRASRLHQLTRFPVVSATVLLLGMLTSTSPADALLTPVRATIATFLTDS